ncbi:hypothetical protein RyT2_07280 [Pseudolactococcus yaeyamensis]
MTDRKIRLIKSLSITCLLSTLFFLICIFIFKDDFTIQKFLFITAYLVFSTLGALFIIQKALKGKELFTYGWRTFVTVFALLAISESFVYIILGIESVSELFVAIIIYFEAVMIMAVAIINGIKIVFPWQR